MKLTTLAAFSNDDIAFYVGIGVGVVVVVLLLRRFKKKNGK
jgi:hypothetical protein